MIRHTSSVQSVLVYATFFTISLMIHMVVVWPQPSRGGSAGPTAEGAAPVASERPVQASGSQTGALPRDEPGARGGRGGVLK